jgi:hypothetical protein
LEIAVEMESKIVGVLSPDSEEEEAVFPSISANSLPRGAVIGTPPSDAAVPGDPLLRSP